MTLSFYSATLIYIKVGYVLTLHATIEIELDQLTNLKYLEFATV